MYFSLVLWFKLPLKMSRNDGTNLALIILVIIITCFLESKQITLAQFGISYHPRLRLANR